VEKYVAVVICGLLAVPAATASPTPQGDALLRSASRLSGLPVRHSVQSVTVSGTRYDQLLQRAGERDYPRSLRNADARLAAQLGLTTPAPPSPTPASARAWYDPRTRRLFLKRGARAKRPTMINELVRALIDQSFNLRRLTALRARNRDGALAAQGIVNGTAALAAGLRPVAAREVSSAERFVQLESNGALGSGRYLAAELRYLGGSSALAGALRSFPATTEQLLHVDKYLEHERALSVRLPSIVGQLKLETAETFGELDVRSLLRTFDVPDADKVAAGWGGGRLGLYDTPGGTVTVLALDWDSTEDATEWQAAVPAYVGAAFAGESPRTCPPLDRCWTGPASLAAGALGTTSVFANGPGAATVAAAVLLASSPSTRA
jgi:hypothetical protein